MARRPTAEETQAALEKYLASRGPTPLELAQQAYAEAIAAAEAATAKAEAAAAEAIAQAEAIAAAEAAAIEKANAEAAAAQAAFEAEVAEKMAAAANTGSPTPDPVSPTTPAPAAPTFTSVKIGDGPEEQYTGIDTSNLNDFVGTGGTDTVTIDGKTFTNFDTKAFADANQTPAIAPPPLPPSPPPYDVDIYEKSDGYWYYRDEDGNEIDIGVRDEDRAKKLLDNYEEVVNENLTPLTDTSAYVDEDGEPKKGYRFGEDGTVFKDIGKTWAQVYVNEDGQTVEKDTGRKKFRNAVDWEKGAEGERREGLGGFVNDVLGSNIAKGLLAVATGGASIPFTTLGTAVKTVADGGNPILAFLSTGAGMQLGNDLIKTLSDATGGNLSSTAQNAITGVFEGKNLENIVAGAAGLDSIAATISEQLTDVVKEVIPDLSSELADGIKDTLASTITQVTTGSDLATALDSAIGGALTTYATTPKDEIDADTIVDEETLDAMSEAETGADVSTIPDELLFPEMDSTNPFGPSGIIETDLGQFSEETADPYGTSVVSPAVASESVYEGMPQEGKDAVLAPYIQHAKDLGYNVAKGALEEWALTVGGAGRSIDEFSAWLRDNYPDQNPAQDALDDILTQDDQAIKFTQDSDIEAAIQEAIATGENVTTEVNTDWGKELTKGLVETLESWSESAQNKISPEMQLRQYYALPAEGMTLEDIANGTAFDRAGRPYGTDKLATMMTGAEEWGDGITDIALVFALGPVGAVATLATSGLAGKEASAREIDATIDRAYAEGDLKDNPAFKVLVEQNGGDAAAAVQALKDQGIRYSTAAGGVAAVSDLIFTKIAAGVGIKNAAGIVPDFITRIAGSTVSEGAGEGMEQYLTNLATTELGTDVMADTGGSTLLGAVGGGTTTAVYGVGSAFYDALADSSTYDEVPTIPADTDMATPINVADTTFTTTGALPSSEIGQILSSTNTTAVNSGLTKSQEIEISREALENAGLDPALIDDILREAGIIQTPPDTISTIPDTTKTEEVDDTVTEVEEDTEEDTTEEIDPVEEVEEDTTEEVEEDTTEEVDTVDPVISAPPDDTIEEVEEDTDDTIEEVEEDTTEEVVGDTGGLTVEDVATITGQDPDTITQGDVNATDEIITILEGSTDTDTTTDTETETETDTTTDTTVTPTVVIPEEEEEEEEKEEDPAYRLLTQGVKVETPPVADVRPAYGSPYAPRGIQTEAGVFPVSPYGTQGLSALASLDAYNQKRLSLPLTRAKTGGRVQNNTLQDALMRLIR